MKKDLNSARTPDGPVFLRFSAAVGISREGDLKTSIVKQTVCSHNFREKMAVLVNIKSKGVKETMFLFIHDVYII